MIKLLVKVGSPREAVVSLGSPKVRCTYLSRLGSFHGQARSALLDLSNHLCVPRIQNLRQLKKRRNSANWTPEKKRNIAVSEYSASQNN